MTPLPWLRTFLSSPLPSLPSSSFHPCKIASPSLSLSIYLSISISISLQTLQSAPRYYLSLLERGTHTIPAHARADLQYRTNGIIHDRCTIRPFLFFSPSFSLSFFLILWFFCPLILALWDSVISHRGGLLSTRGIDAAKKCHGLLSPIRKHDSKEGRTESLAVTHSSLFNSTLYI